MYDVLKENNVSVLQIETSADIRKAILKLALPALAEFGLDASADDDMIQVGVLGPWAFRYRISCSANDASFLSI